MAIEQNSDGVEFDNKEMVKLPDESDDDFVKRIGGTSEVTTEELKKALGQKELVDELNRLEDEEGK